MALVLTLKSVENLPGKADRLIQATYRGLTYTTKIIPRAKGVAYFGQTFEWPVARAAESDESLHIQLFNFSKYLNNKCIGTYSLFLQHLIEHGELKISESLTDHLNRISDINITFEVRYYSPDGKVGQWNQGEFTGDDVDGQSIGSGSSYRPPSGLEDTMSFKFEE
ncbi:hypothetical protein CAPTEDRAFT_147644 [Capitella teleta]|uniref:C2 domain-containing protein n=1 Tax=Capitella teleta TaxID=283909 RepID=R7UG74_CAPTE|nr:hypothetical protein CAPTEDRAFT_147644 [Capitella teleta]|eukprot:ELU05063.1 hypothetical protein CAPTEDRAFT_147644 [Capitella teleta]